MKGNQRHDCSQNSKVQNQFVDTAKKLQSDAPSGINFKKNNCFFFQIPKNKLHSQIKPIKFGKVSVRLWVLATNPNICNNLYPLPILNLKGIKRIITGPNRGSILVVNLEKLTI